MFVPELLSAGRSLASERTWFYWTVWFVLESSSGSNNVQYICSFNILLRSRTQNHIKIFKRFEYFYNIIGHETIHYASIYWALNVVLTDGKNGPLIYIYKKREHILRLLGLHHKSTLISTVYSILIKHTWKYFCVTCHEQGGYLKEKKGHVQSVHKGERYF